MQHGNEENRKTILPIDGRGEDSNNYRQNVTEKRSSNGNGPQNSTYGTDSRSDKKNDTEREKPYGIPTENRENDSETVQSNDSNCETVPKHQIDGQEQLLHPHALLPQPEAPPGLTKSASNGEDCNRIDRSLSAGDGSPIGKFLRNSASLIKRISSMKESDGGDRKSRSPDLPTVTEIHIPNLKVTVQVKDESRSHDLDFKGQISFFSRSSCGDSTAVRSFFRERRLRFVEINVDVYPEREKELIRRSGSASVPKVFFNERLIGGLVELNSMVDGGDFEMKLREMMRRRCPESGPGVPLYGFDDPGEEERTDEMVGIVRVLRQRLPILDRITKMKMVKNCFTGSETVEVLIEHFDCGRKKVI